MPGFADYLAGRPNPMAPLAGGVAPPRAASMIGGGPGTFRNYLATRPPPASVGLGGPPRRPGMDGPGMGGTGQAPRPMNALPAAPPPPRAPAPGPGEAPPQTVRERYVAFARERQAERDRIAAEKKASKEAAAPAPAPQVTPEQREKIGNETAAKQESKIEQKMRQGR